MEVFRDLLPYLKKHIKQLLIGLLGMGVFTLLSLLPPLLLRFLVDEVVELSRWQLLLPAAGAIIANPLISELLRFGNTQIIMKAGYKLISDIRTDIYRKIMYLSMRFHQDKSSGLLVNRLMDDVNMLQHLITGETVNIIIDLIVFIFSVTIVFVISPLLSIILFATLLLYIIAYRVFAGRIRRQTALYRSKQDLISERLQETTAGVRHVRIFNREFNENNQFLNRTNESLSHALSGNLGSVGLSTVCTFIAGFGSAAMVGIGAYMVIKGELKYGDVLAVSNYVWMALNPAIRLTNLAGQLTEIFVSVRRLGEILNEDIDIKSEKGAPPIEANHGRVEFCDVYFSYKADVPLYRGLNLSVESGQTAALVGHTGCGKTTLTALLMRYWDIKSGSIRIDGQDIRKVDLSSLRSLFGVVLQDPVIFDGSLAYNISYGCPGAAMDDIVKAARAAEIYSMAMGFPDKFDTELGTHGVKLSVGEKQRVSIARAVLKDPLILIMDEATSSLDSESEALIQKALAKVLEGRTSFIVAHRLSTIQNADVIVVMDNGAIVESGTHEELMSISGGAYRKLYQELQGVREDA